MDCGISIGQRTSVQAPVHVLLLAGAVEMLRNYSQLADGVVAVRVDTSVL